MMRSTLACLVVLGLVLGGHAHKRRAADGKSTMSALLSRLDNIELAHRQQIALMEHTHRTQLGSLEKKLDLLSRKFAELSSKKAGMNQRVRNQNFVAPQKNHRVRNQNSERALFSEAWPQVVRSRKHPRRGMRQKVKCDPNTGGGCSDLMKNTLNKGHTQIQSTTVDQGEDTVGGDADTIGATGKGMKTQDSNAAIMSGPADYTYGGSDLDNNAAVDTTLAPTAAPQVTYDNIPEDAEDADEGGYAGDDASNTVDTSNNQQLDYDALKAGKDTSMGMSANGNGRLTAMTGSTTTGASSSGYHAASSTTAGSSTGGMYSSSGTTGI